MLFIALFSLMAGFLLNEEACLNRICRSLAYAHEGWLVIRSELGILIVTAACLAAFLKGLGWVLFLAPYYEEAWLLPAGLFFAGNVLAVKRMRGLFYTPWLTLMGIMCAGEIRVFQGVFTVVVVYALVTKDAWAGLKLWQPAFCFFVLLFFSFPQGLYWIVLVLTACIISGRQSPFNDMIIKYFGKILGWRVTT